MLYANDSEVESSNDNYLEITGIIKELESKGKLSLITLQREAFGMLLPRHVGQDNLEYSPYDNTVYRLPISEVKEGLEVWDILRSIVIPDELKGFINSLNGQLKSKGIASRYGFHDIDSIPDVPFFRIPQSLRNAQDISKVLEPGLLNALSISEDVNEIRILFYDACPTHLWINYKTEYGRDVFGYLKVYIFDSAELNGRTFYKYGYLICSYLNRYGNEEHYKIIDTVGKRVVNTLQKEKQRKGDEEDYNLESAEKPKEANDDMRGKIENYSKDALTFKARMEKADRLMRDVLDENIINDVEYLVSSIRRYAKKNGRDETFKNISRLRDSLQTWILDLNGSEFEMPQSVPTIPDEKTIMEHISSLKDIEINSFIKELLIDLKLGSKFNSLDSNRETDIYRALLALLNVERIYLSAIIYYPWNDTSDEPFKALQDVVWFRYKYYDIGSDLSRKKQRIEKYKKSLKKKFAKSFNQRKKENPKVKNKDGSWQLILPLFEKYFPNKIETLFKYFSGDDIRVINRALKGIEKSLPVPSTLTLKLWKALKWAQPSSWRMNSSSIERRGQLTDEITINEDDRYKTDSLMRIELAGENLEMPIGVGFLANDMSENTKEIMLARILRAAEKQSKNIDIKNISIRKAKEIRTMLLKEEAPEVGNIHKELVIKSFNETIKGYRLRELLSKIEKLQLAEQTILYHRLGYSHPERLLFSTQSVEELISWYFSGSRYLYYKCISDVTEFLRSKGSSKELKILKDKTKIINKHMKTAIIGKKFKKEKQIKVKPITQSVIYDDPDDDRPF